MDNFKNILLCYAGWRTSHTEILPNLYAASNYSIKSIWNSNGSQLQKKSHEKCDSIFLIE